jgi:hypothetical protein
MNKKRPTDRNIEEAREMRRIWLQAIEDKRGHAYIEERWDAFCITLRATGISMATFEKHYVNG